jgi:hypothetical protein
MDQDACGKRTIAVLADSDSKVNIHSRGLS